VHWISVKSHPEKSYSRKMPPGKKATYKKISKKNPDYRKIFNCLQMYPLPLLQKIAPYKKLLIC